MQTFRCLQYLFDDNKIFSVPKRQSIIVKPIFVPFFRDERELLQNRWNQVVGTFPHTVAGGFDTSCLEDVAVEINSKSKENRVIDQFIL